MKDRKTIARDAIAAAQATAKYGQNAAKFATKLEMERGGTKTPADGRLGAIANFAQAQLILMEAILTLLAGPDDGEQPTTKLSTTPQSPVVVHRPFEALVHLAVPPPVVDDREDDEAIPF